MKTGQAGIDLIKKFEGCKLTAYRCPAGVPTIGYGHTAGVKMGQTITQAQAEAYLKADLKKHEKNVAKYESQYKWKQNEFDAMVSFAYNLGSVDQLTASGSRSKAVIAEKMLLYNKAEGTVLVGLTRRRQAEKELFLKAVVVAAELQNDSNIVKAVQQWMNDNYSLEIGDCKACGKSLLAVDGIYGAYTNAALTLALQIWINSFGAHIKEDGLFGDNTKAACKVVSEKTNADTRGAQIVQAILFCNGYNPQLFAESFNTDCTKALMAYQSDHGLQPDGAAGKLFFSCALTN